MARKVASRHQSRWSTIMTSTLRPYSWGAAAIACGLMLVAGCEKKTPARAEVPPEVDVARPVVHESAEWDEYTGRLGAVETVEVRARVDGYLGKIHFKAGQIVKKADVLFTIDLRPYEAALQRADAEVKRA